MDDYWIRHSPKWEIILTCTFFNLYNNSSFRILMIVHHLVQCWYTRIEIFFYIEAIKHQQAKLDGLYSWQKQRRLNHILLHGTKNIQNSFCRGVVAGIVIAFTVILIVGIWLFAMHYIGIKNEKCLNTLISKGFGPTWWWSIMSFSSYELCHVGK